MCYEFAAIIKLVIFPFNLPERGAIFNTGLASHFSLENACLTIPLGHFIRMFKIFIFCVGSIAYAYKHWNMIQLKYSHMFLLFTFIWLLCLVRHKQPGSYSIQYLDVILSPAVNPMAQTGNYSRQFLKSSRFSFLLIDLCKAYEAIVQIIGARQKSISSLLTTILGVRLRKV